MTYFTLNELIYSTTAVKNKISNIPNDEQKDNLVALVENVLDPAREMLGQPIHINSGFRCQVLNKKVGGVPNSQHTKGQAADLSCYDNFELFEIIKENLTFDQLIWEEGGKWLHISYKKDGKNRQEIIYN